MKCKRCGLDVSENSKFCGYCGEKVEKINTEEDLLSAIDKAIGDATNVDSEVVNETIITSSQDIKETVEPVTHVQDEDASVQTIIDIIKSDTSNNNVESIEKVVQQFEQLNNNAVEMSQTPVNVESIEPVDLIVPVQPVEINEEVLSDNVEEEKLEKKVEISNENIEMGIEPSEYSEYKEETEIFVKPIEFDEQVVSSEISSNKDDVYLEDKLKQDYLQKTEEYIVPNVSNVEVKEQVVENKEDLEEDNLASVSADVSTVNEVKKENKKGMNDKDKRLAVIVAGISIFLAIQILLVILITTAANKSSGSIEVLKRSVSNLQSSSEQSGTINTKILVENTNNDVVNLSAILRYSKNNGIYDIAMTLNKSLINDEINLYSKITDSEFNLYVGSNTFDLLGLTSSQENKWLQYTMNISNSRNSNKELFNELDEKYVKYVGSENGSKHYQITVDKKLVEYIKSKLLLNNQTVFGNLFNLENIENYVVDFYLNEKDELEKISIDLTDIYANESISKIVASFEFSNLNNTIVTIPQEALNSQVNLIDYINLNKKIAQ